MPLMTERMVEALEIEGKHHEVHWYDDEGHGWERRENRRDAFKRILAFLKMHVLDETATGRRSRLVAAAVRPGARRCPRDHADRAVRLEDPSLTSSRPRRPCGRRAASSRRRDSSSRRASVQHDPSRTGSGLALEDLAEPRGSFAIRPLRPRPGRAASRGDDPAGERRVLADHRVLDRVGDDQEDDEVEDRELAHLALAGEAEADDEEDVDDRGPDRDVEEARPRSGIVHSPDASRRAGEIEEPSDGHGRLDDRWRTMPPDHCDAPRTSACPPRAPARSSQEWKKRGAPRTALRPAKSSCVPSRTGPPVLRAIPLRWRTVPAEGSEPEWPIEYWYPGFGGTS